MRNYFVCIGQIYENFVIKQPGQESFKGSLYDFSFDYTIVKSEVLKLYKNIQLLKNNIK